MDLRGLGAFVEVVRQGGFTRAAAALHVTQPAVSKAVRALEDEIGVPLLERGARRTVPTDAGRAVLGRAEGVLAAVRAIEDEVADLGALRRGRARVGLPPMVSGAFFPPVLAAYRQRYPGIQLELREEGAREVEALVASGALDVGVTVLPTDEARFEALPFVHDVLAAVLHPASPLARRPRLALADLAGTPFLLYRADFALRGRILDACRAAGFLPQVASETGQWDFMAAMAAADVGVALLPRTICRRLDPAQVAVVPLAAPAIGWNLGLVWRREGTLSAAARAFVETAREVLLPRRAAGYPAARSRPRTRK
ncbi:transcriptional regulator, LysR family [Anaeromyxobacter dehalogenans 2CP-1]|uniref:Transcriptional regulator, LysR family n=1 Tax=Anaeromyxobacter dehalogenans (strain ATCC BAA-258 / DSM 21875 / 2CP-1) TaxID=455488 RepID=B8J7W8_ANAD2|nr:LysR family transcriptional regulator [Anaeromyxobacter dehalogenans]ACL63460.1 transcriptional regulator, LysR family [Anaeromyxobacter dehalogenans 2CP-1]